MDLSALIFEINNLLGAVPDADAVRNFLQKNRVYQVLRSVKPHGLLSLTESRPFRTTWKLKRGSHLLCQTRRWRLGRYVKGMGRWRHGQNRASDSLKPLLFTGRWQSQARNHRPFCFPSLHLRRVIIWFV